MLRIPGWVSMVVVSVASVAQTPDGLPVEHVLRIAPGSFVDLDSGMQLPSRQVPRHTADLTFDRDGAGFFALPFHGAQRAAADATAPGDDWSPERQRLGRRDTAPRTWFVRTDRGSIARVTLTVVDPYSTASAVLQWAIAPAGMAQFEPGPRRVRARWDGEQQDTLLFTWEGEAKSWLVEHESGGTVQKHTVARGEVRLPGLDPNASHRVRVRGLHAGGVVSLPTEVVQSGRTRPAARGIVAYGDNWYDATGGLSLRDGAAATEDADVVFYLYGVYVPGGGVQKLGTGEAVYAACAELPDRGYLPSHGRLDDHDVYAVRLPDGRCAKLWLAPQRGGDLRSGMDVHFTFLADGRRELLPRPANPRCERTAGGFELRWDEVPGADGYQVLTPGATEPTRVEVPRLLLAGLPPDAFHRVRISAVSAAGDESDPSSHDLHTFGDGYRVGSFRLDAGGQQGFDFAAGAPVARDAEADLRIANSAGGASSLSFATPAGGAPGRDAPFGSFAGAGALPFGERVDSDDRDEGAERFYVRTEEGGVASVRIVAREYPVVSFEYVYRLPAAAKKR